MFFARERIGEIIKQLERRSYINAMDVRPWRGKAEHFEIKDEWQWDTSSWEEVDPAVLGKKASAYFGITAEVVVPDCLDQMPVEVVISTGREGQWDATNPQIAAYVNGQLTQGLDVNHRALMLTSCARAGEKFEIFLSVYTGESGSIHQWRSILRGRNEKAYQLYYDLLIPWQCLELMEEDSQEYLKLLRILNETINRLDFRNAEYFAESVDVASDFLKEETKSLPVSDIVVSCIGHTHIDVAWLWTTAITEEKVARSFSTVLNLMEKYPEYQFMSSQAQLYKYVKKNQPKLYEKIKERVKEGRWETEGGMFVEADCNLASGESLIRQFLYGKKFFREEFGQEHQILWLPDVFGYSAALPQIMKKCGIQSFMTTKISWNEVNKIPYDSFWWEGIDGSRVLTHFITARDYNNHGKTIVTGDEHTTEHTTNYNGVTHPSQIKGAWQRYQQKDKNENVLLSYGYGDGGGGTTDWMIETALRLQRGNYGTPRVKLEKAGDFFKRLHRRASETEFPVWSGELYLEYHRGTYTSMASIKRANRKAEFALQNAETWATLAKQCGEYEYPKELLLEGWEILMRNQFHDILPGSAIEAVYKGAEKEYSTLFELAGKIQNTALETLASVVDVPSSSVIVFNPNGIPIDGIVQVKDQRMKVTDVPAKGWKVYPVTEMEEEMPEEFYCTDTETVTPFYHLKWNEKGQITSYYDKKAQRELLREGACANVLMTYEDKPHLFDNWNIYDYYREKSWEIDQLLSREVIEQSSLRIALELRWKYLNSEIKEVFYFYPDSPRIDISAEIQWRESQILLKALFPLELNTREACYEIQYGNVRRSTTRNQSWEQARFEVCFHKWFDLAEYDYGVSFLTDSKYGVSVNDSQVELTLLKSGTYPNPRADRGYHEFVYAIYPHQGSWQEAGTVKQAYEINNPVTAVLKTKQSSLLPQEFGFVSTEAENLIFEVLKEAEDGDGEILRFYECWNCQKHITLTFAKPYQTIALCNMLEQEERVIGVQTKQVELVVKPYEIVTLKLIEMEEA